MHDEQRADHLALEAERAEGPDRALDQRRDLRVPAGPEVENRQIDGHQRHVGGQPDFLIARQRFVEELLGALFLPERGGDAAFQPDALEGVDPLDLGREERLAG